MAIWFISTLAGCGPSQVDFEEAVQLACTKTDECGEIGSNGEFENVGDCETFYGAIWQTANDEAIEQDCDPDASLMPGCFEAIELAPCENVFYNEDACLAVAYNECPLS